MKTSPLLSGALALVLLAATGVRAEVEAFLQIPTIPGEADEAAHGDWIDIESFSFGAVQRPGPGFGLFAAEFVVAKRLDKASPLLFLACAQGTVLETVTLDLIDDFGPADNVVFHQVILTDARVASVNLTGETAGTDRPLEEVAFTYGKVEIRYSVVDPDTGIAMPQTPVTWDYVNQTP